MGKDETLHQFVERLETSPEQHFDLLDNASRQLCSKMILDMLRQIGNTVTSAVVVGISKERNHPVFILQPSDEGEIMIEDIHRVFAEIQNGSSTDPINL